MLRMIDVQENTLKGSRLRITKLDGPTCLDEQTIHRLKTFGEFIKYDDLPSKEETIKRLDNTDVAIVESTSINRDMFKKIKKLKYIIVPFTGYEFIDIQAAKEHNILVSNIPDYARYSAAEYVFATIQAVSRKICQAHQAVRAGKREFFEPFLATELYGKTLGIIGLGSIGSWVARIGEGFGMNIINCSRTPKHFPNITDVQLEELLIESDFVVLCVDFNETTSGMLSKERLSLMKKAAIFVSIAPTGICDEMALAELVKDGKIAGAGLDAIEQDSPLERSSNVVVTPSIGWYTTDAQNRRMAILINSVQNFIVGKPINLINT